MQPTTTYAALTGAVLAHFRRIAGRQQIELAGHVGVNQSAWSKMERGAVTLSLEYLALIAPMLGTTPGEFMGAVDRVVKHAEAQGLSVLIRKEDLAGATLQVQVSTKGLATLVELALG